MVWALSIFSLSSYLKDVAAEHFVLLLSYINSLAANHSVPF